MNILSLQGGGVLGRGQISALESFLSLARFSGTSTPAIFDLIGGTSVGAIIGAILASGGDISECRRFFDESAPAIFSNSHWMITRLLSCDSAKYSPVVLESRLKTILGDATLADCRTRFIATAVDMRTSRNVYFQSYDKSYVAPNEIVIGPDSGWKLWEVARASSAAQTYFPAFEKDGMILWDGGTTGNNCPDMLLLAEALALGKSISEIQMLSMGNGKPSSGYSANASINPSFREAIALTLDAIYNLTCDNASFQAEQILTDSRYTRVDPALPKKYEIDDARPDVLSQIVKSWESQISGLITVDLAIKYTSTGQNK